MKTDAEIQKDVMEELRWEPLLNASEIGVAVKNGIVTLSGTVDTYGKKVAAEDAAKSVMGVKAVAEDIQVKLSSSGKRNDTEIAEAVMNALKWHSAVREDKIKVKVEDGWVTLEGEADWEFQRSAARSMVEDLTGVIGIINNIRIKPSVVANDIKKRINSAFHRSATVDSEKINLEVVGSKVILTGKVRSYAEKRDAENAAWLAPGINKIENKLQIDTEVFAY
ncbi:MAG: BON domain-containing protein [Bacteroidetes bacterium]|nr:MAG: BON domain-containing protein [Bacteroidota bacterium]